MVPFTCLEMFTVERLLSRGSNYKPKSEDHHHLESVEKVDDSGRESLGREPFSDIDPGEEGIAICMQLPSLPIFHNYKLNLRRWLLF